MCVPYLQGFLSTVHLFPLPFCCPDRNTWRQRVPERCVYTPFGFPFLPHICLLLRWSEVAIKRMSIWVPCCAHWPRCGYLTDVMIYVPPGDLSTTLLPFLFLLYRSRVLIGRLSRDISELRHNSLPSEFISLRFEELIERIDWYIDLWFRSFFPTTHLFFSCCDDLRIVEIWISNSHVPFRVSSS